MNEENKRVNEKIDAIFFIVQAALVSLYCITVMFFQTEQILYWIFLVILASQLEIVRLIKLLMEWIFEENNVIYITDDAVVDIIFFVMLIYPIAKLYYFF